MRYRWLDSFSLFPCNQKGLDLVRWVRALRIRLIYMLTLELRLTRRPWSWLRNGIPVLFLFSFFSGKVSPAWIRSCVSSGLGQEECFFRRSQRILTEWMSNPERMTFPGESGKCPNPGHQIKKSSLSVRRSLLYCLSIPQLLVFLFPLICPFLPSLALRSLFTDHEFYFF